MTSRAAAEPLPAVDVAVVGAGVAGLFVALTAAGEGARVALVSRSPLPGSASYWAQGGVAAVLDDEDSVESHLADTVAAGRGAVRASAAEALCAEAPDRVRELQELGVRFDADRHGRLALGLEGGHSARRVAHAGGSATGRRITRDLAALVAAHEHIQVLENTTAGALWTDDGRCVGLVAEPTARGGAPQALSLSARATVLATGGSAALWERTTNPRGAIGAGMTLAAHGGAALADLELVQFHPTALVSANGHDGFLITEAVRGEGALLIDAEGERFVDELLPRDRVALAVADRARLGHVRLDMREVDLGRFPNVASTLAEAGFDASREPVPVAPAAHYTMGGIATDIRGRSSLAGLYAVGECACTGLHGANRLASNSLAECLVFGRRAALRALDEAALPARMSTAPAPGPSPAPPRETRGNLWRLAGLERTEGGLRELTQDPFHLARAIAACALAREESRGAHRRTDHPAAHPRYDEMHAVVRDGRPAFERWV